MKKIVLFLFLFFSSNFITAQSYKVYLENGKIEGVKDITRIDTLTIRVSSGFPEKIKKIIPVSFSLLENLISNGNVTKYQEDTLFFPDSISYGKKISINLVNGVIFGKISEKKVQRTKKEILSSFLNRMLILISMGILSALLGIIVYKAIVSGEKKERVIFIVLSLTSTIGIMVLNAIFFSGPLIIIEIISILTFLCLQVSKTEAVMISIGLAVMYATFLLPAAQVILTISNAFEFWLLNILFFSLVFFFSIRKKNFWNFYITNLASPNSFFNLFYFFNDFNKVFNL